MIVEVMGRKAGWIALYAGVAGGGDVLLLPEIPYRMDSILGTVKQRNKRGKRFSIIVVAEGARPSGGDVVIKKIVKESTDPVRLGGIGFVIGDELERLTGLEARTVVMGHLQRGGSPTAFDRVLATELAAFAVDMMRQKTYGNMAGVKSSELISVPLEITAEGPRTVPPGHRLIRYAREIGVSFGD
jgi:6-phosphofructokinase 1